MSMIVRDARLQDAPIIVEFNRRLAVETEDVTLDPAVLSVGVDKVLRDSHRGRYFVAAIDDRVVGQIMITYEWSDWRNGWIWWLQSVYVAAEFRDQGVFRSILEYVLAAGRAHGDVVGIRLYVERDNVAAQKTYQRLKFNQIHFDLMQRMPLD